MKKAEKLIKTEGMQNQVDLVQGDFMLSLSGISIKG